MAETDKKDSNLPFDGVTAEALSKLIESKSINALAALGGCETLLKQLKTCQNQGLSTSLETASLSLGPWINLASEPSSLSKKDTEGILIVPSVAKKTPDDLAESQTLSNLMDRFVDRIRLRNSKKENHSRGELVGQATMNNDPLHERRAIFGTNKLLEPKLKTFWEIVWKALQDKTLISLMVAAALDLGIGIYKLQAPKRDPYSIIGGFAIVAASK
jgi:P-type Ca2+ transporter type 2C